MDFSWITSRLFLSGFDILLVLLVLTQLFKWMRGTKGVFFLNAIVILFLMYSVSHVLKLDLFTNLLQQMMWILMVAVPIIFQNELKQALESLGHKNPIIKWFIKPPTIAEQSLDLIAEAAEDLSGERIGALIIIEREASLTTVIESGSLIDGLLSKILVEQVFYPNSPLHDGAVIIKGNRVEAAGCFLPLDNRLVLPRALGSRHRAGLTLTTQSDALVIIVSEENGKISLANNGLLEQGLSGAELKGRLKEIINPGPANTKAGLPINKDHEAC